MAQLTLAATQMPCETDLAANLARAERLVRRAHAEGAQVILLQELFEYLYFCQDQDAGFFSLASALEGHPWLGRFQALAAELAVVLPVSFFERATTGYFNSLAMIDADGRILGVYRKSHIPQGPGYEEKFYFAPGDTGFRVWRTRYGVLGAGICWDQWFPEAARAMVLAGAEVLLYPTAIGSEPADPTLDSHDHWQRTMQGHAAANLAPLVASNRSGTERGRASEITFYGGSFIAGATGELLAKAGRTEETVITATVDLDAIRLQRAAWGVFRDRRPELYEALVGR
ncbi:MAG: N-carbamoylputrescine amidase [Gammaproteobacteria bacterium]|nr:N-carbamoylputrescine amidase [Gammaproteobacteria bacterium]